MKKKNVFIIAVVCISSAFIINIIALIFLLDRDLSTGMAILLENSLIFLGLLLITLFITAGLRITRGKEKVNYYETLFRSISKHMDNGLAILDNSNCFQFVTPRFKQMLELEEISLTGHNALDVLPKSIYRFVMEYRLNPGILLDEPVKQTIQFKESYIQLSAFSVGDSVTHARYVIILHDCTRQILMEKQLTDQLEEVQFHIECKESLLANVSHELKTPLNAIIGLSHILEDTPINNHQREIISKINVSSDFLLSLINDVLNFSKLKNGTIQLEPSHFRLSDLLDDLRKMFLPLAARKNIHLIED